MNGHLIKSARHRARQAYYLTPNFFKPLVKLSEESRDHLLELREKGITQVNGRFRPVAEYINEKYVSWLEDYQTGKPGRKKMPFIHEVELDPTWATAVERPFMAKISFVDPVLRDLFFAPDLSAILYNFFKRQIYHRNYPIIFRTRYEGKYPENPQGKFHKDGGLGQISFMLLLNDLTMEDTHMEYALGSHRKWASFRDMDRFSYPEKRVEDQFEIYHCLGEMGTLFIFDASHGFHRATYKLHTERTVLHLNITTGSSLRSERFDTRSQFDFLAEQPHFVRHMMDKIAAGP